MVPIYLIDIDLCVVREYSEVDQDTLVKITDSLVDDIKKSGWQAESELKDGHLKMSFSVPEAVVIEAVEMEYKARTTGARGAIANLILKFSGEQDRGFAEAVTKKRITEKVELSLQNFIENNLHQLSGIPGIFLQTIPMESPVDRNRASLKP